MVNIYGNYHPPPVSQQFPLRLMLAIKPWSFRIWRETSAQ